MKLEKVFTFRFQFWTVMFALYWVILPAGNLVRVNEWGIIDTIISGFAAPIILLQYLNVIFGMAEPYELDRVHRYGNIVFAFIEKPFGIVVAIIGFAIMIVGNPVADSLLKITILLFGFLFVALGLRWYGEDICGIKLPKRDTL